MDLSNLEAVLILGWGSVEKVRRRVEKVQHKVHNKVHEKVHEDQEARSSGVPTYTREKTLLILICPNVSPPLKV